MHREKRYFVYIMANRQHSVFYLDVTANMQQCLRAHRGGKASSFCRRNRCRKLVWYAETDSAEEAWRAAKRMQHWPRADKIAAIVEMNPYWRDLTEDILK
jgi:putative endonuclease